MDKNNVSVEDSWNILVEEGVDKILGITKDEFDLIASLNSSGVNEEETSSIIQAYRAYKKYRNKDDNVIKSS